MTRAEAAVYYRDRYYGETCFVLGNGPSLTHAVLVQIGQSGFKTFVANGFRLVLNQIAWSPTFACMSNHDAVTCHCAHYPAETVKFVKEGCACSGSERVVSLPFACEHDKGIHRGSFLKEGNFSLNPFQENFCGETVLLDFAIPLAVYMGFTRIVLAGVDCDYSKGYFVDGYEKRYVEGFQGMINDDYSIIIPSYRYAFDYLRTRDIALVRVTESVPLEFIPAVAIESIIKKEGSGI